MKKAVLTSLLFILFTTVNAQITYQITYSDLGHCDSKSVIQNSDGTYMMVGSIDVPGQASDILLIKTDSAGSTIWSAVYSSFRNGDTLLNDYGYDVKATADGYVICGTTYGSPLDLSHADVLLIKTDLFGGIEWADVYGGGGTDEGFSVSLSKEGGYYITGHANDDGINNNKGFILKVDAAGDPVWYKFSSVGGNARFNSGSVTNDSGFVAAGSTVYSSGSTDVFLVKYDKAGKLKWGKRYSAPGDQQGYSVTTTTDGGCIVAGSNSVNGTVNSTDMLVIKSDPTGTMEWSKTYHHLFEDRATKIIQMSSGNYAITGYSNGTSVIDTVRLGDFLNIDSNGGILNSGMFGDFTKDCFLYGIFQSSDHGFMMSGVSNGLAGPAGAAYVIKTDSAGSSELCPVNPLSLTASPLLLSDSSGCDTTSSFPFYNGTTILSAINSISFGVICADLSVKENVSASVISVYPNPVAKALNIALNTRFETLIVYDVFGRKMLQQKIKAGESIIHLNTETLIPGVYSIELTGYGNYITQKFIKVD